MTDTIHRPQPATTRDVAPRFRDSRVRIRVDVRPTAQVIEGHMCPMGINEILVPSSRLPVLQKLVETDEDRAELERAKAAHERKLAKWVEQNDPEDRERAVRTYGGSVEAEFYRATNRSVPVLRSLEVLEENIPRDLSPEEKRDQRLAATLAESMRVQSLAERETALAEKERELAAREAELASKGGKR